MEHGAELTPRGVRFRVWAPRLDRVAVRVAGSDHALRPEGNGWFSAEVAGVGHGARYAFVLPDGATRPDPASRAQPAGVHDESQVFDPGRHAWRHGFPGQRLEELTFYELHVGTFTDEGTLDAAAARLPDLVDLGISCVELLPVQPFPGARNWGYDGVFPHAVHEAYGGPAALQRFVDAAHGHGLAVCLDVVYNHLGPEGNYLSQYGPYFTDRHRSLWGDGVDLDGPGAAPVRAFFLEAAFGWLRDFRVDALRLDATHAITDGSPRHLVRELCERAGAEAARARRRIHVIAENDENDRGVISPPPGGWGCSAVWADDLHHALHAWVTGERGKFLADYGRLEDVAKALAEGFVYQGQRSGFRGRAHGTPSAGLPPSRFVTCLQNHDQVGNRPRGERISALVPWEALEPLAGLVILGSGLPLLLMGEEYGEPAPFQYFTSHTDPDLARAVSEGRKGEFIAAGEADVPDPQEADTFRRSRLSHRRDGRHGALRARYRELLAIRRRHLDAISAGWPAVEAAGTTLTLRRPGLTVAANLAAEPAGGLPGFGLAVREG